MPWFFNHRDECALFQPPCLADDDDEVVDRLLPRTVTRAGASAGLGDQLQRALGPGVLVPDLHLARTVGVGHVLVLPATAVRGQLLQALVRGKRPRERPT